MSNFIALREAEKQAFFFFHWRSFKQRKTWSVWQWSCSHVVFVCWVCGVWVWHKWDSCHIPGDVSRCHHIPLSLSLYPPHYRLSLSPDTFQSYRLSSQITGICLLCTILHIPGPCVTLLDRGGLNVVLTQDSPHTTCLPPPWGDSGVWKYTVRWKWWLEFLQNSNKSWIVEVRVYCLIFTVLSHFSTSEVITSVGKGKFNLCYICVWFRPKDNPKGCKSKK